MNSTELILEAITKNCSTEAELRALKVRAAGTSGRLLKNSELVAAYNRLVALGEIKPRQQLANLLRKARGRTLSGVSVVAVLTRDFGCPGRCIFCPTERGMPKSYLSNEPAVMRAIRAKFDPWQQVTDRVAALTACGHPVEKIELIVMGGTFSALPRRYQTWFIRRCLQALNPPGVTKTDLESLKRANEVAQRRLVGLTLETRPDFITPAEVQRFLRLGCTRVELGAQSLDDEILRKVKRGHDVAATKKAILLLKNAGLKVGLHLMPNLPGATPASDLAMFRQVFESPDFAPDQLKIYPCVLVDKTVLKKWWQQKKWRPYSDTVLTKLLTEIKKIVPPWVRLSRIIRDIPAESILAGSKITNLRQILQKSGVRCACIRCREIRGERFVVNEAQLVERRYPASGGEEVFLSFELPQRNRLLALARLRINADKKTAFLRELHSYGAELEISRSGASGQHRGFGRRLVAIAEKKARAAGAQTLKIAAGVGVRPYYRRLGFRLDRDGIYLTKKL